MGKEQKGKSQEVAIKCAYTDMVPIGDLKPHPKNPNRHPPKQIAVLARLMLRLGMRQPITVSNLSGYIVRGHGRLEACKALKMAKVPVDFQDYADEAEEMADLLADNRIPELSELDMSAAWENLGRISNQFKLEDLGFMKSEFKDVNLQAMLEQPRTRNWPRRLRRRRKRRYIKPRWSRPCSLHRTSGGFPTSGWT